MSDQIGDWLQSLGLDQYLETFRANDLDLDLVADLNDGDLEKLGVASMGHRKKLMRAIDRLSAGSGTANSPAAGATIGDPAAPGPAIKSGQAERRQLTVLFCDLVESTALSRRLDPEDMRDLMRRYHEAVSGAINRYEGHVAKFLGDGVLAYFGWPQAHEDQAERAVHSGLAAIAATVDLSTDGIPLNARVGIATGLVVVGDLAGESDAIVGETPNLAARLQALARPGEVVIGETTHRLVGGTFDFDDLGAAELKGFSEQIRSWKVVAARASASRFESAHATRLTPLIGRDHELALLREHWRRAGQGNGQITLVSGDAGIGKSRLLAALGEAISDQPHVHVQLQCSPYHMDSAFYPVARQIERAAGFAIDDTAASKLDKLAGLIGGDDLDCAAVATVMSVPTADRFGVIELTPQQIKLRAIEVILRHIRDRAGEQPVLITFEDLHWIDPSSQELLVRMVTGFAESRVLAVMTHRPEYQAPFALAGNVAALALSNLSRAEIMAMVQTVAGRDIDAALVQQIVARADGIPLFVEEMTKNVTEAGASGAEVPDTLQASLLSRLDRLGAAKEIAQIGAVIGRDFDYPLLARVAEHPQDDLIAAIDRLVGALLVFQSGIPPDARYTFKHALVQDAAYDSLLKSRREVLHGRIAAALEQDFPNTREDEPEILARHHTASGNIEPAIKYWRQAGERAAALSSGLEACNHFERAIALLETLPPNTERDAAELPLRLGHAGALQLTRGPADLELGKTYARALELSTKIGEPAQHFAAMFGMWRHNFWRHGPRAAVEYSDGIWLIGENSEKVSDRVLVHYVKATTAWSMGDFAVGAQHAGIAWSLFSESTEGSLTYRLGHNQGVSSLLILSYCQWGLGRPTEARSVIEQALTEAEAMAEPLTLTIIRVIAADVFEMLGDERLDDVEGACALAREFGFGTWAGYGDTCLGWLKHRAGETELGLELMRDGLDAWRAAGARAFTTGRLAVYGRMCLEAGQLDRARQVLTDGERLAEETGDTVAQTEIERGFGTLTMAETGDRRAAENHFRRALTTAEARGAFGFALRAAIDLAGHLDDGGRQAAAYDILSAATGRFKPDDDTADLRLARALLDRLA